MKKCISCKFIILFFTLIFFIAMICYFQFDKNARSKGTTSSYLESNSFNLYKDFNEAAFNNLTKDLNNNNLILSLYDDNLEENYKIDFQILKYLNAKSGVKSYMTDLTYSDAYVVNEYLKTGNENILKELFKLNDWDHKFNNGFYDEIINIYNYNKSISKNKVVVMGVFPQNSTGSSCLAIKYMMPNYKAPENIAYYINAFKNNLRGIDSKDDLIDFSQKLDENIKNNHYEYNKYFGANFKDFDNVVNDLIKCAEFIKQNPTNTNHSSFIDSGISENINKIQLTGKNEKWYGAFRPDYYFGDTKVGINIPTILSSRTKYKFITVRFADSNVSSIKDENIKLKINNINGNTVFIKTDKNNSSDELKKFNYLIYVKGSKPTINSSTEERDGLVEYLNKNKASLGDNNKINMNGLALIDNDISQYDVFLTGESHDVKVNKNIQLSFLKYLNNKANVKYFLCEMGYTESRLLNNYLKTGDKLILEKIMNSLAGTSCNSDDYVKLWTELYDYNKTLPKDKKIQVVGVDVEHQINPAIDYLNSLIPKEKPALQIAKYVVEAKTSVLKRNDYNEIIRNYTEVNNNINDNINLYRAYLGDNFFDFKLICENILNAALFYENNDYAFRDKCMYSNFIQINGDLPKGKYYGQFGSGHTILSTNEVNGMKGNNMATLMNGENLPLYKRVLSIPIVYSNCYFLNNGVKNLLYTGYKNQQALNLLSQDEVQLFKLNGENSPFNKKLYLVNGDKGVTTDYFQYALFVRNSPASSHYTGIK